MPPKRQRSQSVLLESNVPHRLRADDVNEALAFVDYCVAKCFSLTKVQNSIVKHLERICVKVFTFKQIDDRMKNLWLGHRDQSTNPPTDHTHIYLVGTKALLLKDNQRIAIRARVQQLISKTVFENFNRGDKRALRKRKAIQVAPDTEVQTRASKKVKRVDIETSPSLSPETASHESITVEIPHVPIKEREDFQSREPFRDLSQVPDSQNSKMTSPSFSPISPMADDQRSFHSSYSYIKPEMHTPPTNGVGDYDSVLQALSEREKDLKDVHQELSEAKKTIRLLEDKVLYEERRSAVLLKDDGKPTQETLNGYLEYIGHLESRLEDKQSLLPFTTWRENEHIPTDVRHFQENMYAIRGVIENFMSYQAEMLKMCDDIKVEEADNDLRLLLQRVIGDSHETLRFVPFQSLLRSLLSAAVCEWVFESNVREHIFTSCPLRETMLAHLTTQDSADVARNLDFATHHTLINTKYYQDGLIPRRAEDLVDRIYRTITPVFGLQTPLKRRRGDTLQEWNRKRPVLREMFVSALRIKAAALVSKNVFEVILPSEGSKYDKRFMEIENLEGENSGSLPGQISCVRLSLVPGLRMQRSNRKLVDYKSFQKPGSDSTKPFDRIAEAIVHIC